MVEWMKRSGQRLSASAAGSLQGDGLGNNVANVMMIGTRCVLHTRLYAAPTINNATDTIATSRGKAAFQTGSNDTTCHSQK